MQHTSRRLVKYKMCIHGARLRGRRLQTCALRPSPPACPQTNSPRIEVPEWAMRRQEQSCLALAQRAAAVAGRLTIAVGARRMHRLRNIEP